MADLRPRSLRLIREAQQTPWIKYRGIIGKKIDVHLTADCVDRQHTTTVDLILHTSQDPTSLNSTFPGLRNQLPEVFQVWTTLKKSGAKRAKSFKEVYDLRTPISGPTHLRYSSSIRTPNEPSSNQPQYSSKSRWDPAGALGCARVSR